jgi:hypothetical protein
MTGTALPGVVRFYTRGGTIGFLMRGQAVIACPLRDIFARVRPAGRPRPTVFPHPQIGPGRPILTTVHFFANFAFLVAFFGFVGSSNVVSTACDMSVSVTPFATAFRTAFLMRFTAFFCFFASPAICGGSPLGETGIVRFKVS